MTILETRSETKKREVRLARIRRQASNCEIPEFGPKMGGREEIKYGSIACSRSRIGTRRSTNSS